MKKILFLFILSYITGTLSAQANLVSNYSFEDINGTLECIAGPTPSWPNFIGHGQEHLEEYWEELPPWTVPEMMACGIGAGSSDHLCNGGNTGTNYGRMLNREYICAPLGSSLISGKSYYIEFYIKASSSLSDVGLKFSEHRPKQCGYNKINIDGNPSFEIDNNLVFNYVTWTKVTGYYTAVARQNAIMQKEIEQLKQK
ncbi:hypothetical protein BH11BAC7_BH11BAC7_23240 [soil metagenome]